MLQLSRFTKATSITTVKFKTHLSTAEQPTTLKGFKCTSDTTFAPKILLWKDLNMNGGCFSIYKMTIENSDVFKENTQSKDSLL